MMRQRNSRRSAAPAVNLDALWASCVRAGVAYFDNGSPVDPNPYSDPECAAHFRNGWLARRDARRRWDEQLDIVNREIDQAKAFLDAGKLSGAFAPSDRIRLLFLMFGSAKPDEAFAEFQNRMAEARSRYRRGFYADPFGEPRERLA